MRFFAAFLIWMAASFPVAASGQMSAVDTYDELMKKGQNELQESYNPQTPELSVRHASEAVKLFRSAGKLRPNNLDPVFLEGVALFATNDYCLRSEKLSR